MIYRKIRSLVTMLPQHFQKVLERTFLPTPIFIISTRNICHNDTIGKRLIRAFQQYMIHGIVHFLRPWEVSVGLLRLMDRENFVSKIFSFLSLRTRPQLRCFPPNFGLELAMIPTQTLWKTSLLSGILRPRQNERPSPLSLSIISNHIRI